MKLSFNTFITFFCLVVATCSSQNTSAEVFKNIHPSTQPDELAILFSGTSIEIIQIEGQGPSSLNLVLTGTSIPGGLVVGFTDWLKFNEQAVQNNPSDINRSLLEDYRSGKERRYSLDFVRRIVENDTIPVSTLFRLYGKRVTKDLNKDTLSEIYFWKKSGVVAEVKNGLVKSIEYYPTTTDAACEPYLVQMVTCPTNIIRKAEQEDLKWEKTRREANKKMAVKIGREK